MKQTIELIDGKMKPEDMFPFLPEIYEYMAMDKNGYWYAYSDKPIISSKHLWNCNPASFLHPRELRNIYYTGDWKDSLHERPSTK